MALTGKAIGNTYKTLLTIESEGGTTRTAFDGITSDLKDVVDGNGTACPLSLSTTKAQLKPSSDSTTAVKVVNSSGSSVLTCDTTNRKVLVGQNSINPMERQEVFYFWGYHSEASSDYWYAMTHNTLIKNGLGIPLGNGSSPSTTYTVATSSNDNSGPWMSQFNQFRIFNTIDITGVWLQYQTRNDTDTSSGNMPSFDCNIMSYQSTDSFSGANGSLESGTVHATLSGSTPIAATFIEKSNAMTISGATVTSTGAITKPTVLVPCIRYTTVNGANRDLLCKMYVNYVIV